MADENERSISDLFTAERTSASDLYETAIPSATESGYISRKVSASELANLFNKTIQYSELESDDKTVIGAINQALSSVVVEDEVTADSNHPVTSKAIYDFVYGLDAREEEY
jgi:hypothetical protein